MLYLVPEVRGWAQRGEPYMSKSRYDELVEEHLRRVRQINQRLIKAGVAVGILLFLYWLMR